MVIRTMVLEEIRDLAAAELAVMPEWAELAVIIAIFVAQLTLLRVPGVAAAGVVVVFPAVSAVPVEVV